MSQTLKLPTLAKLLPELKKEVWILAVGRFLLHIGQGFTLVYASIFFVDEIGLSATQVGLALGFGSVSGVVGRFIAGSLADSVSWGRKKTLLMAAAVSVLASLSLAFAYNFPSLIIGNLLMSLGIGLYWPPTEAMVADLTSLEQRNEAFATTRLADSLGLGLGVFLAGKLIAIAGGYRTLFLLKSFAYLTFLIIIWLTIEETRQPSETNHQAIQGWKQAFRDRIFVIWLLINILFTTYDAQINSTLPLYFANFIPGAETETGFTTETISLLFFFYVTFNAIFQLPVARFLNKIRRFRALMLALVFWGGGFSLIWLMGIIPNELIMGVMSTTGFAYAALFLFACAKVIYVPSASSLVGDLAPESLRGIYFSLEAQCWAVGYFIGPSLGGWVLDQPANFTSNFWLIASASISLGLLVLFFLDKKHL